jgi:hypothetical protein
VLPPAGWFQTAPNLGPMCAQNYGWGINVLSTQPNVRFDAINFGYAK